MGCLASRYPSRMGSPRAGGVPKEWEKALLEGKIRDIIDLDLALKHVGKDKLPTTLRKMVLAWKSEDRSELERCIDTQDHKEFQNIGHKIRKKAKDLALKNVKKSCDSIVGLGQVLQNIEAKRKADAKESSSTSSSKDPISELKQRRIQLVEALDKHMKS